MRDSAINLENPLLNSLKRLPGVALMLLVCIVVFSILSSDFLSIPNITNIGVQSTILLMISLPMTNH